jgi:hypothetical protein
MVKGKAAPMLKHHSMKAQRTVEVKLNAYLTLTTHRRKYESLALCSSCFIPDHADSLQYPLDRWLGGLHSHAACDSKEKIPATARNQISTA